LSTAIVSENTRTTAATTNTLNGASGQTCLNRPVHLRDASRSKPGGQSTHRFASRLGDTLPSLRTSATLWQQGTSRSSSTTGRVREASSQPMVPRSCQRSTILRPASRSTSASPTRTAAVSSSTYRQRNTSRLLCCKFFHSRSVVVNHSGLWPRKRQFESAREY
jgi:hypothetical protein